MNESKIHHFTIIGQIGEGAQGLVLKAIDNKTEKIVALKKVLLKKSELGISETVIREIKCLQQIRHPCVIKLFDAFPNEFDFIMVFEYMPMGLWESLKDNNILLHASQIKTYMKMLLKGLSHIHERNIMHRDLKPANLLLNREGILKIADFGLGRLAWHDISRPYSHQVATRWYRAPELLYGARYYTSAVDMWSFGCILGEMFNNSPLFPGETDIEQLALVLRHLGSPTTESWPELLILPDYNKITFPHHKGITWESIMPDATTDTIDIIRRILLYDSSKRLTAKEALGHEYFYTKPYDSSQDLIKPLEDHCMQVRPKEINVKIGVNVLFKDLLQQI